MPDALRTAPRGSSSHAILRARPHLRRYAMHCVTRHFSGAISREDALAIADMAACTAWPRYRPGQGATFVTYARHWVFGCLARASARECAHREATERLRRLQAARVEPACDGAAAERAVDAQRALDALTTAEQEVIVGYAVAHAELSGIAERRGHHRSWASRRYRDALARSRRRLSVDLPA